MYRILPSVSHKPYEPYVGNRQLSQPTEYDSTPNQLRWDPFAIEATDHDFVDGLRQVCAAGSPEVRNGLAVYIYTATQSMDHKALNNSDGDLLLGTLHWITF